MGNILKIFPDYFSESAVKLILLNGQENNLHVYRVGKYGKDKEIAFLNYYDEVLLGLKTVRERGKYLEKCKNDIDRLSVSCYYEKNDIVYYLNITLKDQFPERILLEGYTDLKCGLSQKTDERKKNVENSHVDWWLYKDATPWDAFQEV